MAIKSGQLTVGTTRIKVPAASVMPWRLEIKNADNTDDLFIGNGEVTTTTGMRLAKLERIDLTLSPLDEVYLISAKAGHKAAFVAFTQDT